MQILSESQVLERKEVLEMDFIWLGKANIRHIKA